MKLLIACLAIAAVPSIGVGQLCQGTASFSAGPVRLGAGGEFADGVKALGGQVAFGAQRGPFGGINVARYSYDELSESSTVYGGHVGFAVPVGATQRVEMCPVASFDIVSGPDFETGFGLAELSGSQLGIGLSFGGIASSSPTFDFVPFASIAYYHQSMKATLAGNSETNTDDVGGLTIGAGFVLNKVVTLLPSIAFPIGVEDGDPSFGIRVALNLGAKK